jgi:hypothetical protein
MTLRPEVGINDAQIVLDEATWVKEYTEQSEYSRFSLGEWVREEREASLLGSSPEELLNTGLDGRRRG